MKPIDFPQANRVLGPPAGMEATCDPLNVLVAEDGSCMSLWELDPAELVTLAVNGGRICVFVHHGDGTQPPISFSVPGPWEVPKRLEHDSTNKGPTVKPEEAAVLRELIAAMRGDGIEVAAFDIGLFERLVHTAEVERG